MKECKGEGCYCEECVASAAENMAQASEHKADPKMMKLISEYMKEKMIPKKISSLKELKKIAYKKLKAAADGVEDSKEDKMESHMGENIKEGTHKDGEEVIKSKFKGPKSGHEKELRKSPNHEYMDKVEE